MFASTPDELRSELGRVLGPEGLHRVSPRIRGALSLSLREVDMDDLALGASRVGGQPDLPEKFIWPHWTWDRGYRKDDVPMTFVAQLALADLAPLRPLGFDTLPDGGWLVVFVQDEFSPQVDEPQLWEVLYLSEDTELLRCELPEGATSLKPRGLAPELGSSLPFHDDDLLAELDGLEPKVGAPRAGVLSRLFGKTPRARSQAYVEFDAFMAASREAPEPHDQIGGYARPIQDVVEEEVARITGRGSPEDWLLVLQLDCHGRLNWGDAGLFYLLAHRDDLTAGRFDRAVVHCQFT